MLVTEEEFLNAAEEVKKYKQCTNDEQLELYGWYKQATIGEKTLVYALSLSLFCVCLFDDAKTPFSLFVFLSGKRRRLQHRPTRDVRFKGQGEVVRLEK